MCVLKIIFFISQYGSFVNKIIKILLNLLIFYKKIAQIRIESVPYIRISKFLSTLLILNATKDEQTGKNKSDKESENAY